MSDMLTHNEACGGLGKKNFQIVISTSKPRNKRNLASHKNDCLVICQGNTKIDGIDNVIYVDEIGLSKSRNRAIKNADGEICLFSDDDVEFKDGVGDIVLRAFNDFPQADIITFQIETPNGQKFKKYHETELPHTIRTIMRVSSIEIAFRTEKIKKCGLKFDELFGLGADYPTGEEVIFLADALRKGLRIHYVPIPIVIHSKETSGSTYTPSVVRAKGAMFARIFGFKGIFACLAFIIKKYWEYKGILSLRESSLIMLEGFCSYVKKTRCRS